MYESLDPSRLPELLVNINQAWEDARANMDFLYLPYANTFAAILDATTARLPTLQQRDRSPEVKMAWMEACEGTANYSTGQWLKGIPCDFSGWAVGTNNQTVRVTSSVSTSFAVPLRIFDNLFTPEQLFETAYMKAQKLLLEKWNEQAIAKLIAYSGYNKYQLGMGVNGGAGPTSWKLTRIPYRNLYPASFNAYIRMAGRLNKFLDPRLICGGALEVSEYVEGSLEQFQFGNQRVYSDLETFPSLDIENDMFLMARGAVAFVNINEYSFDGATRPPMGAEEEIYFAVTMPNRYSVNGQPLVADVTRKRIKREIAQERFSTYVVDNRCEWYDEYHIELKGEIMLNPLACSDTTTGVLRFRADDTLPVYLSPTQLMQTVDVGQL